MRIETLLRDEIQDEFENLKKMKLGSEEYRTTVEGLSKLVDRAIELEKIDIEYRDKVESRETDIDFRERQMKEEKRDRYFKNGISVAGILIPCAITIWGTVKSLRFEETGTVTTIMGRGFINKLLPKK